MAKLKTLVGVLVIPVILSYLWYIYDLSSSTDLTSLSSYVLSIFLYPYLRFFVKMSEGEWTANLRIDGVIAPVSVYRDKLGIPYIFAQNDEDLLFAQGFVTAIERHAQINLMRLYGQGRLSEFIGEAFLSSDLEMRMLGLNEIVKRSLAHTDPTVIRALSLYSKGVSKGLELLPRKQLEFRMLGVAVNTTWTVEDSALLQLLMGLQLNRGWNIELSNLVLQQQLREDLVEEFRHQYDKRVPYINPEGPFAVLYDLQGNKISIPESPPMNLSSRIAQKLASMEATPFSTEAAADTVETDVEGEALLDLEAPYTIPTIDGSNGWAVSGAFTESGKPVIAGDMHLMQTAPGTFFPVFLYSNRSTLLRQSNESLKLIGASLPGVPGIIAGHNEVLAASMTVSYVDTDDLFDVELTADRLHYIYEGRVLPLDIRQEWIYVKGKLQVQALTVKSTHHGPIVSDAFNNGRGKLQENHALVLSSPLFRSTCGIEGIKSFAATNWRDLFLSVSGKSCVELVTIWGDTEGNIGNFLVGGIPRRAAVGQNRIRNGTCANDDWIDFLTNAEIPHYMNPPRGYAFSANSLITPDPSDLFGYCAVPGHRQWRIDNLLSQMIKTKRITVEDFQIMQTDQYSMNACDWSRIVITKLLKKYTDGGSPCPSPQHTLETIQALHDNLIDWDCFVSTKSPIAPFMEAWIHLTINLLLDKLNVSLVAKQEILGRTSKSRFLHELGIHIRPTLVRLMNEEETSVAMKQVGGSTAILCETLDHMMNLTKKLYKKPTVYMKWTDLQDLYFSHGFTASAPILKHTLSVGPFSPGGNFGTIHMSRIAINDFLGASPKINKSKVSAGPVIRMVMDAGDWSLSKWIVLPGTSGWAASRNYGDQLEYLKAGELHPMLWNYEDIVNASVTRLLLLPSA